MGFFWKIRTCLKNVLVLQLPNARGPFCFLNFSEDFWVKFGCSVLDTLSSCTVSARWRLTHMILRTCTANNCPLHVECRYLYSHLFVQPLLPWKNNKYYIFWVCVCSLSYLACKAHGLYYIAICGLSGSIMFFHGTIFGNTVLMIKCLDFLCNFYLSLFSFADKFSEILSYIYLGPHVKYPLLWLDFN